MTTAHLKPNYDLHRMQDQHHFLSHNHHQHLHHQQPLRQNRPKASRTHRSKVDDVRSNWTNFTAGVCQPEAPVTLAEFAQCRQLPSVVRVVHGRFGTIGCDNGGGSQGELDSEIYVHSIGSSLDHSVAEQRPVDATVLAQVLRFEDSNDVRHNGGRGFNGGARNQGSGRRLVPTGRTVCLPIDGSDVRPGAGCWFELMSEDGRSAPPITSVKDLADRALSVRSTVLLRYLVRETVYGTVNNLNSATVSIHQGNTITPVRCVSSMDFASVEGSGSVDEMERFRQHRQNRKPDRLQCVDSMNRSLFLPLDQVGLFSPVADDSDRTAAIAGSVYDGLGSIVAAFRLPVTVRLVCGQLSVPNSGNSNGIQSSIFRLTAISQRLEGGSRKSTSVESAIFVMSLRQAWSVDPRKKSANSEDKLALTCIPQSAAGALLVESASQDFYSWLTSDDGLELGRRCDRIIATGNFHATPVADAAWNATDDDRRQYHHSSITSPPKELQRRASVDSGLASSAINDELYDEIDNIYCMIRYGAPVGAAGHFYCPEPDRYGRTKSFDNAANRPFDGFLLPPPQRPQRIDGKPEVGITIENFKQPTPSRGRMQTVAAVVTSTAAARCRQAKTDALLDSNDHLNFNGPASRPASRPPSRSGIANVETGLSNANNIYARLDFDGRSEPSRSRKSSLVAYALENNRNEEVESGACRKSTGFSPIAIAYSGMTSGIGEVFSDMEQGSGNADVATSGESAPPRKHSRMPSADDAVTNEVQQTANGGTRGAKSKNGRWTTHPVEQSHIDQMQQAVAAAEAKQGTPGTPPPSGNNKRSAFSMALSRSLEALRRVTRRSTGNAAISTETEPEALSPDPRHDKGQQQRRQSETSELQPPPHGKKRSGLGGGSGGKTKNGKGSKQQTTWYDIDIENKTVYDDVDVFDYDIGDGRPNADVRREWFETARSRRSWAAPAIDGISFGADSLRIRRRKPKDRGDDPPLILSTMFGDRRQTKPSAIFDGYYSGRADDMQFTAGQYKSFGQF